MYYRMFLTGYNGCYIVLLGSSGVGAHSSNGCTGGRLAVNKSKLGFGVEGEGVEPSEPRSRFVDYKATGPTDAQPFRRNLHSDTIKTC